MQFLKESLLVEAYFGTLDSGPILADILSILFSNLTILEGMLRKTEQRRKTERCIRLTIDHRKAESNDPTTPRFQDCVRHSQIVVVAKI